MTSRAPVSGANLLIRGGYVLTMDSAGDLPGGDVHLRDGVIQQVGANLDVPEAEVIDAAGKIVLPGLVDTHWHMWNTLLRGMSDGRPTPDGPDRSGYFATCVGIGRHFLPGDTYAGTRLAAAEAIDAGITTVHDWAHNIRGLDWAEAGLRALGESGLRARFSYGYETGHANDQLMALDDLAAIRAAWPSYHADDRIHLGVAWRGTGGSNPAMRVAPRAVPGGDRGGRARSGCRVSVHACGPAAAAGQVRTYADEGLLGPDLQLVHLNNASAAEIALAARGRHPGVRVAVDRAADRLRPAGHRRAPGRRAARRAVCRHHDALGQRRPVRGHEGDAGLRQRPGAPRVRAHRPGRAPAGHDRRRADPWPGRGHRLPRGGQARGRHRGLRRLARTWAFSPILPASSSPPPAPATWSSWSSTAGYSSATAWSPPSTSPR